MLLCSFQKTVGVKIVYRLPLSQSFVHNNKRRALITKNVDYLEFNVLIWCLGECCQEDEGNMDREEKPVIGISSGLVWLIGMTITIALLSEYVVGTIEVYTRNLLISNFMFEQNKYACSLFIKM